MAETREQNLPLVVIDFRRGRAIRYQRRRPGGAFATVTANMGQGAEQAHWGGREGLELLEKFRTTGEA